MVKYGFAKKLGFFYVFFLNEKNAMQGSQAQLLAAFQKHSWMWELLLRKHLADLLLRPAAAQIFVEAAAGLPSIVQERLYSLWRQQLLLSQHDSQPLHLSPVLLQQLLEQLRLCFQARSIALPQLPGDVPQTAGASAAAADAARQPLLPQSGGTEVRVVLREHLPSLLHLLLTACCCGGGDGRQPAEVTSSQQHADGSSGRASGNAPHAPSLSSMQSAAAAGVRQSQRPQAGGSSSLRQAQQVASGAGSSPVGACCQVAVGSSAVREGLLRHAVLLVSKLSNPDALHEMLSILPQHHAGCGAGADSDSDRDEGRSQQQQRQLSRRDAAKVQTAVALIEVCLDGMLTLPTLAAAVHQQLHGKASSTGGGVTDSRPAQQDARANPSSSGAASRPAAASAMAASVAEAAGSQQAVCRESHHWHRARRRHGPCHYGRLPGPDCADCHGISRESDTREREREFFFFFVVCVEDGRDLVVPGHEDGFWVGPQSLTM